jgi:hypothetical protein
MDVLTLAPWVGRVTTNRINPTFCHTNQGVQAKSGSIYPGSKGISTRICFCTGQESRLGAVLTLFTCVACQRLVLILFVITLHSRGRCSVACVFTSTHRQCKQSFSFNVAVALAFRR